LLFVNFIFQIAIILQLKTRKRVKRTKTNKQTKKPI